MRRAEELLAGGSIVAAGTALRDGSVTSRMLVAASLARARQVASLNAYVALDEEGAAADAAASDDRVTSSARSWLEGVPVCVKDAFCTTRLATSCGSRMLAGWQAGYEATAVARLREAGGVVVGKTNLDEFCMGSSNAYSVWGPTFNPLGQGLTPGGSSGGTAAAVAAGTVFAGLGSDTGGSVRQPAAFCGVVGFKPTYGAVSRHGMVAMASSLDTVGVVARSIHDVRLVFDAIKGPDGLDSTADEAGHQSNPMALAAHARIGVSNDFYPAELSDEIVSHWRRCALELGWDGDSTIPMPHTRAALPAYYAIASAEAASNLSRYDGVRYGFRAEHDSIDSLYLNTRSEGFGVNARRRILMGTFVLSRERLESCFEQAQKVRRLVSLDFERAFEHADVLLVPTVPAGPRKMADILSGSADPVTEWMGDLLTVPASLAGLPAVSVPVGKDSSGMPVSMQVIGPRFADQLVLNVAEKLMYNAV